jgi:hypothetical protein
MTRLLGPVGVLRRAGDEEWGGKRLGVGMVERFYVVARQYGIKTEGEGAQGIEVLCGCS